MLCSKLILILRGKVKFLTGGIARELNVTSAFMLIWLNSRADSIVWMGEGDKCYISVADPLDNPMGFLRFILLNGVIICLLKKWSTSLCYQFWVFY